MHPQDPAGGPEGDAGGDALPVCLPQPVSVHLHQSLSLDDDRLFLCCAHRVLKGDRSEHSKHGEMTKQSERDGEV